MTLLDEAGHAVGTAAKSDVHHRQTPLHLAFSCYVFDPDGALLLTRRALHKPTWPGVWTNTFCGHPAPGEDITEAVRRRGLQELGMVLTDLQLVLPAFRYTAQMPDGVRENEMCPVFTAVSTSPVVASAAEVAGTQWVDWAGFRDTVLAGTRDVSPWCVQQVRELSSRETSSGRFRAAPADALPPAAR